MKHVLRVAALLFALACSGCVTDDSGSPRPAAGPRDATPRLLSASAIDFRDSDANGLRDSTLVYIYVFGADMAYPLAADGTFEFRLTDQTGKPLCEWVMDEEESRRALENAPIGPRYAFVLDLRTRDREAIAGPTGTLTCTFRPTKGQPVSSRRGMDVAIGRAARADP